MSAALTDFLPWVRSHLPGCPQRLLLDGIREACIEWAKRTRILQTDLDYAVHSGNRIVSLVPASVSPGDPMEFCVVWEVLKVVDADDRVLDPTNQYDSDALDYDTQTGSPRAYYLSGRNNLILAPIPDANGTITVKMVIRPSDDAATVDDILFDDWRDPIAAGARAWIRRNYGNWLNPSLLAFDSDFFEKSIDRYNTRRAQGGVSLPLRTRMHSF